MKPKLLFSHVNYALWNDFPFSQIINIANVIFGGPIPALKVVTGAGNSRLSFRVEVPWDNIHKAHKVKPEIKGQLWHWMDIFATVKHDHL